tara:strand:+ start:12476 stop:13603 length:1128 start_codon:yes stop_codon:yes gene_type:complete
MDELKRDISTIIKYPIENIDDIDTLVEYSIDILSLLYDKKFVKKYIYKGLIKQFIAELRPDLYGSIYNHFITKDHSVTVEHLQKIPQFEQRTPAWFKFRQNNIGASEAAIIFGKSIFSNEKKLLLKKCGHKIPFVSNPACQHGTKYEPIVQLLYQIKNRVKLFEFGSIAHPEYSMISASPDGITETGVMVEIKVPYKRLITGGPPIYYWYQMQQQMQVCNLDRVDFVECDIKEYFNKKLFLADSQDKDGIFNTNGDVKNVLLEIFKEVSPGVQDVDWIYPDRLLTTDEIDGWISEQLKIIEKAPNISMAKEIYFKVNTYSSFTVWRDDAWWDNNRQKYIDFWNTVKQYKKNGYDHLLVKKPRTRKVRIPKCLIED